MSRNSAAEALVKVLSHADFHVPSDDQGSPSSATAAAALESALRANDCAALKVMLEQSGSWPVSAMQTLLADTGSSLELALLMATEAFRSPIEAAGGQSLAELFVAGWQRLLAAEDRQGAHAAWIIAPIDGLSLAAARKSSLEFASILAAVDTVTLGIGAGSAELNLGILLGLLEARESVESLQLLSLATGEYVDAQVAAEPIRRLLRQRQFADARRLAARDLRKTLARLDAWQSERGSNWSIDGAPLEPITRELAFFDQVAAGSAQATVQGRRWLEERFIELGGRVPSGASIGGVKAYRRSWSQSSQEARQFYGDHEFLVARAASKTHHRDDPLLRRDMYALRADEARVRLSDPRLRTSSAPEVLPFWATPSGSVLVGLCLGLNADVDVLLSVIAANRARLVEIATGLSEQDVNQLAARSTPVVPRITVLLMASTDSHPGAAAQTTASRLDLDLLVLGTGDPTNVAATRQALTDMRTSLLAPLVSGEHALDGAIFLVGPGRQEMQVGTLLGLLELTESAGAHMHVGSLQRQGDDGRTEIRLDQAAVALFPDSHMRHIVAALAHIDECEYAAATTELGSLAPSRDAEPSYFTSRIAAIRRELSSLAYDLEEPMNEGTRSKRALAAAERMLVFKHALDQGELSAQATASRLYVPLERALRASQPKCDGEKSGWYEPWIRDLLDLRNQSTWNHGDDRHSVSAVSGAISTALRRELALADHTGSEAAADRLLKRALQARAELSAMAEMEQADVT